MCREAAVYCMTTADWAKSKRTLHRTSRWFEQLTESTTTHPHRASSSASGMLSSLSKRRVDKLTSLSPRRFASPMSPTPVCLCVVLFHSLSLISMLIRLETVGSCHYFRVTVPRTADVSPSWVALWASRINLLRFAQALLTTIAVVTLTIRYTFVARVLRA